MAKQNNGAKINWMLNNTADTKKLVELMFSNLDSKDKVKSELDHVSQPIDEVNKKWATNDRITKLYCQRIEDDSKLKKKYANILIGILLVQLLMLNTIFILKGCGKLEYSDTTFNIFITGGLAEVFVLVKIIVSYLFNDNLSEHLNIILKSNNRSSIKTNRNKEDNKVQL